MAERDLCELYTHGSAIDLNNEIRDFSVFQDFRVDGGGLKEAFKQKPLVLLPSRCSVHSYDAKRTVHRSPAARARQR
jgi:hypothetical protein